MAKMKTRGNLLIRTKAIVNTKTQQSQYNYVKEIREVGGYNYLSICFHVIIAENGNTLRSTKKHRLIFYGIFSIHCYAIMKNNFVYQCFSNFDVHVNQWYLDKRLTTGSETSLICTVKSFP
jgi:hypothetical protein